MRSSKPPASAEAPAPKRRSFHVLVVDDEAAIRQVLAEALASQSLIIDQAGSLEEARRTIASRPVDLVLADVKLPDGSGLDLASELRSSHPNIQSIVMTGKPSLEKAIEAIRIGACDFLAKPFNLKDLNGCVERAIQKRLDDEKLAGKVRKLKKLCRKLNHARHEITQQVDILCNDLVTAYQELAGQMKHVQLTTQLKATLSQELDLEQVLRRVLEFVLQQVGPTNAVVFMPAPSGAFSTGGYVNYTFDKATGDVLLAHLADVAAPRIADAPATIHLTANEEIHAWLADDSTWLEDCHLLGVPCRHNNETLAAVMLFRDGKEPFTEEAVNVLPAIAQVFAAHLVKVINIHHRHVDNTPGISDEESDDNLAA